MGRRRATDCVAATALLLVVCLAAASAGPAPRTLRYACAGPGQRVLHFVPRASRCSGALVNFAAGARVRVCPAAGLLMLPRGRRCAPSIALPRARSTHFCAAAGDRSLRLVGHGARCRARELAVVLPKRTFERVRAGADLETTDEDHARTIDVLANDRAGAAGRKLQVTALDTAATRGKARLDAGGTIEYDPGGAFDALNRGQVAWDSFTYQVSDSARHATGLVLVVVTGADDGPLLGEASGAPAATQVIDSLAITTQPGLIPAFSPAVSDYAIRCDGRPVGVSVEAPPGTEVALDGQAPAGGSFAAPVSLAAGQGFQLVVTGPAGSGSYHVRCLPSDFPPYVAEVPGTPQAQWYFVSPSLGGSPGAYAAVFDADGVPVWWMKGAAGLFDFKLLASGNVGRFGVWNGSPTTQFNEFGLDGTFVRATTTVGAPTNDHEYEEAAGGHRYVVSYKPRDHVDVSAYSGKPADSDAAVRDAEVQELDQDGGVVWSWNSATHIGLEETGRWWAINTPPQTPDGRNNYDVAHINSVEDDGDGIVISLRHTDAVYRIDKATGDVDWKLGGTARPESLTIIGDPLAATDFGGQHDARVLPDGTLTLHDNGTRRNRPPRALRFAIDTSAHTATLLESVQDPGVTGSSCCGSARKLATGDWVMSWGGSPVVTELAPDGTRQFKLTFGGTVFSYRAAPVPPGVLSAAALRAGMDAQHPRP